MTVVALDGMGGDFAPRAPVEAAVRASRRGDLNVILVGPPERLSAELARHSYDPSRLTLHPAGEGLSMDQAPAQSWRGHPQAPVRVALELVAQGRAQAAVSAGHSGAMMVAGKLALGMLEGVERPAIATPLPVRRGVALLLDSGANVDCKPHYLAQFGRMGALYVHCVLGVESPRVALLSNGAEPGKGNALVREAWPLMEAGDFDFVGNLEGRDLFKGRAEVIVTDGFNGNLVLKTAEAVAGQLKLLQKEARSSGPLALLGYWLLFPLFKKFDQRADFREVGGSLLLGLKGTALVCHGGSNPRTLENALYMAARCAESRLEERLAQAFAQPGPAKGQG